MKDVQGRRANRQTKQEQKENGRCVVTTRNESRSESNTSCFQRQVTVRPIHEIDYCYKVASSVMTSSSLLSLSSASMIFDFASAWEMLALRKRVSPSSARDVPQRAAVRVLPAVLIDRRKLFVIDLCSVKVPQAQSSNS